MSSIASTLPLYDGLLHFATDSERVAILACGSRVDLAMSYLLMLNDVDYSKSEIGYAAIHAIIDRIATDLSVQFTGCDRDKPLERSVIDADLVAKGNLVWTGMKDIECLLELFWCEPVIEFRSLRIEPRQGFKAEPVVAMNGPSSLGPLERIDDNARLTLMQHYMNAGQPAKTAARLVAIEMPNPPTSDDSLVKRLVRKFNKLKGVS